MTVCVVCMQLKEISGVDANEIKPFVFYLLQIQCISTLVLQNNIIQLINNNTV